MGNKKWTIGFLSGCLLIMAGLNLYMGRISRQAEVMLAQVEAIAQSEGSVMNDRSGHWEPCQVYLIMGYDKNGNYYEIRTTDRDYAMTFYGTSDVFVLSDGLETTCPFYNKGNTCTEQMCTP